MRRKLYSKAYTHNRYFVPTYYCYLKRCQNPEYKHNMCEKHLKQLQGANK